MDRAGGSRTRLSAEQRRAQLVSVAGALFAEYGFHGLSMDQIAEAAGVSKPVLYQHFPSKRHLYLALLRGAVVELEEQLRTALAGTSDNRARIHAAIQTYFDFVEDPRFHLLFGAADLADADVRQAVEGARASVAGEVAALIAADAGLEPARARLLAAGVSGLAMDGARWWAEPGNPAGIGKDEAVHLLARLLWRGLGAFPAPVHAPAPGPVPAPAPAPVPAAAAGSAAVPPPPGR